MSLLNKISFAVFLCIFPFTTYAWNALGHMVVAHIAYQYLDPKAKETVDSLVATLHEQYKDMPTFQHMAYWPDTLRIQKIETYTHWHYIDIPFSTDGTTLKNTIDTDNAVWALENIKKVVKNKRANPYERSRFLAFLTHIVGDLHQPLHTVSYISATLPNGDQGGNLYFVNYNNKRVNLHKIWDSGFSLFVGENNAEQAQHIANTIMARYPQAYFGAQIKEVNADNWAKEGVENAKKYVYSTPSDQPVSSHYVQTGQQFAEQNTALAGYRLAVLLNQLLV
jgi:hypothetical protein